MTFRVINGKYTKAVIYTDKAEDNVIEQLKQVLDSPSFTDSKIAVMPDTHAGIGSIVGLTATIAREEVVPNIVGGDIGCGVTTAIIPKTDFHADTKQLDDFIRENIPSGFNVREHPIDEAQMLLRLIQEMVAEYITMTGYERYVVAERAMHSLGTLGGGNHFIELGEFEDNYYLTVHSGSRSLGQAVCNHYQSLATNPFTEIIREMREGHKTATTTEEHLEITRQVNELPKIPKSLYSIKGEDFHSYLKDMAFTQHYARVNRAIILEEILDRCCTYSKPIKYIESIHNYIDFDGVIRKGAVKAVGGQELIIPLNMRDGIILAKGKGNPDWNYSAPHGAGRLLSRGKARRELSMKDFEESMAGVDSWSVREDTLEESPMAYKDKDEIISLIGDTVDIIGVIKPLYNFKAKKELREWEI